MSDLLIHPITQQHIDALRTHLPHALLVTGPQGIGLLSIATMISNEHKAERLVILPEKNEVVDREKGTITVDVIRRLYEQTKTKTTVKRMIIIDAAERMGVQAQNAFLKLLEEPTSGIHFVLLSHQKNTFLPTILSRVSNVDIHPITTDQSELILDNLSVKDHKKRTQLLFMANGLPAELTKLANDTEYFARRAEIMKDAQEYLTKGTYARLILAKKYKDNRSDTLLLLSDALKLLEKNIHQGRSSLIPSLTTLMTAYDRIQANGNIRLQLSAVMV